MAKITPVEQHILELDREELLYLRSLFGSIVGIYDAPPLYRVYTALTDSGVEPDFDLFNGEVRVVSRG